MARTFVTGSSGVIGFELLDALTARLAGPVSGVSRRPLPMEADRLRNVETAGLLAGDWLPGDAADATVVHCAGLSNPRIAHESVATLLAEDVAPHGAMVEGLVARGWRGHLVYLSSGGAVYGDVDLLPIPEDRPLRPKGQYGLQKASVETMLHHLARRHGFRLTVLRLANAYGMRLPKPGQGVIPMLIAAARAGRTFDLVGTGEELLDHVHVDDVAAAVALACGPGADVRVLNVGSGVGTSVRTIIATISRLGGRPLDYTTRPSAINVVSNVLDIGLAGRMLGWAPEVDVETGIARMLAAGQ